MLAKQREGQNVDEQDKIKPRVEWKNRQPTDVGCGVVFLLSLLAWISKCKWTKKKAGLYFFSWIT